jgi:farnesyl-diphosphate farnesyltransferase
MTENALGHFGDSITYLEGLENGKIFRFCAIPQVMAIGTLSLIFNNPNALVSNVKMSKISTLEVFTQLNTMQDFAKYSIQFMDAFDLKESDVAAEVILNSYKKRLAKYA